ncbi:MAG: hypothetical protein JO250_22900 [Armatimonadetes bacterium]|nr:hypothetical protein [Armatimonadota bacterium]
MPPTRLPPDLERQLQNELDAGEAVLWSGQPLPGRYARQGIAPMLFGIPFTAFAVFWMYGASGFGHPINGPGPVAFFWLFGLPFLLIGLGMLLSPLWLWRKAGRTAYAVTDRRVLILGGGSFGSTNIRNVPPPALTDRTRTQFADGSGNLLFPRLTTVRYDSEGDRTTNTVGLYGIPDVKGVDDLIRRTFGN